jgi:heme/copper-type cytochrome/quinol oxidase subunit 3
MVVLRRISLPQRNIVIVNRGPYWHLVDIIWICSIASSVSCGEPCD